jgi:rhodanese-related sulfurtransferase
VPELEEAFQLDEDQFAAKYNFSKPAKDATNVVVGCRSGRRAVTAIEQLQKQGYQYLK